MRWALCSASLCWGFSFGLGAPLASLWLSDAGYSTSVIGLNTGIYYLGIALTAGAVPWMMRRSSLTCLVTGMLASGLTVGLFPWGETWWGWFLLRLVNGVAGAMSIIPMETLINRHSAAEQRARNFGYYAFSMATGIGMGTLTGGELYATTPHLAFLVGGLAVLPGTLGLVGWMDWQAGRVPARRDEPAHCQLDSASFAFGENFLSFGSAWSQGFLEGAVVALLPVYLLQIGLSEVGIGWLMGGIMIGVIVIQVPVAWLADRLGRTAVLLSCYGVTVGALSALYLGLSFSGLAACLFTAGACSSAFYPLGLAILGEHVHTGALARANAWYLGINCLGSLIGPVLAGAAMDWFGKQAIFLTGVVAVMLILVSWSASRLFATIYQRKPAMPTTDTEPLELRDAA
jgi:MFS family permease